MIDTVVFDLGGVLIDWNPRYLYRQLFDDEAAKLPIASPGQAIVFYDGDEVLGGGTIRGVERVTEHGGEDAERG